MHKDNLWSFIGNRDLRMRDALHQRHHPSPVEEEMAGHSDRVDLTVFRGRYRGSRMSPLAPTPGTDGIGHIGDGRITRVKSVRLRCWRGSILF